MSTWHWRRWIVVPLVASLALLLAACGGPSTGDVEGQVLAMREATQQPSLQSGVNVVIASSSIERIAQTDAEGKYSFKGLPAGNYGIAFSIPPVEGQPVLQPEERQFNISPGAVETVSVVLLSDAIARPEVPPELQAAAQNGQAVSSGSSLMGNPFFWYFMFNQPWLGGYTRPPVVVYSPDRTLTPDTRQPAPGRAYTNYGPPGAAGTKPAPTVVQSKGVTRPGQSGALPAGASAGAAGSDASKGIVRPGQSATNGAAGSSGASGASGARTGDSTSPPRVGAGGGGTAGRSSSPPRVRIGRR
jgi:hypothetical protein